jgi:hypothetical protein
VQCTQQEFLKVASQLQDDFPFVFTTNDALKSQYKYSKNAVAVFKPPQRINEKYEKPKSRYPSKKMNVEVTPISTFRSLCHNLLHEKPCNIPFRR